MTNTDIRNLPGAVSWGELLCNDPEKMQAFYEGVLGYTTESSEMPGFTYHSFQRGGKSFAGMMKKPADRAQMPSLWGLYFTVEDIAATVAKVQDHGGRVMAPPTPIPGVGQFAVLADPEGAVFQVMQYEMAFQ